MALEKWSDTIAVVRLASDPQFSDDIDAAQRSHYLNLVLDFSDVKFINSSNIAQVLRLRHELISKGGKVLMCCAGDRVWGTFLMTGLDKVFEFGPDLATALATLQIATKAAK